MENLDMYKLGIEEMDSQHMRILLLVNKMKELLKSWGDNYDETHKIIQELIDYTLNHFEAEEYYLKEFGFSEEKEHKEAHDQYKIKMKELKDEYERRRDQTILSEVELISDGWGLHINNLDRKYVELFKEHGL